MSLTLSTSLAFDPNNTGQKLNEGWESVNYKRPSRNVVSPQKIRHRMMILMERLMKWMKIVRMIGNFIIQKNVLSRMDAVLAGMVSNILAQVHTLVLTSAVS
ncbi:hypothetical protein Tco_0918647 [Tanacetum coccineum]